MKESDLEKIIARGELVIVDPNELESIRHELIAKYLRDIIESIIREYLLSVHSPILPIKITQEAFNKAVYISQLALPSEIGLYLLGFRNERQASHDIGIIRDIYIPPEQSHSGTHSTHCDIESGGTLRAEEYAQDIGARILGWAHSHNTMSTFHSPEDNSTLRSNVNNLTLSLDRIGLGNIYYDRSMVFNAHGDPPFCAVAYKPQLYSNFYLNGTNRIIEIPIISPEFDNLEKEKFYSVVTDFEPIGITKLETVERVIQWAEYTGKEDIKRRLFQEKQGLTGNEFFVPDVKERHPNWPSPQEIGRIGSRINTEVRDYVSGHVENSQYEEIENRNMCLESEIEEEIVGYQLKLKKVIAGKQASLEDYERKADSGESVLLSSLISPMEVLDKMNAQNQVWSVPLRERMDYAMSHYQHTREEYEQLRQKVQKTEEKLNSDRDAHYANLKARMETSAADAEYRRTHSYSNEQYLELQQQISQLEAEAQKLAANAEEQRKRNEAELEKREMIYHQKIKEKIAETSQQYEKRAETMKTELTRELEQRARDQYDRLEEQSRNQIRQELEIEYAGVLKTQEQALSQSKTQNTSLSGRLDNAEQQIVSLNSSNAELKEKLEESERNRDEALSLTQQYKQRISDLEERLDNAEVEASQKDGFFDRFKNYFKKDKVKKAAKTILNYSPVVGALITKDGIVDNVIKSLEDRISDSRIDGKELHEIMYQNGVNNIATRNAIKKRLEGGGISIDGKVESAYQINNRYINAINNIGIGKYKIGSIGGGVKLYRGRDDSKWDAFKRNIQISGEVSAVIQAAAIATFGYSLYQGLSTGVYALSDKLKDTPYGNLVNNPIALATALLGGAAAINSGNLTAIARSAGNLYNQSSSYISRGLNKLSNYFDEKKESGESRIGGLIGKLGKHNDKFAYLMQLASQGLMVATIAEGAQTAYQHAITGEPYHSVDETGQQTIAEPLPVTREPTIAQQPPVMGDVVSPVYHHETGFTQPQMDELAQHGWKYAGDGKFEYKLGIEDERFGRGISQILMNSDKVIGDDTAMSARESGLLAHQVATTPPSEVDNIGNGTFEDLKNPNKYIIHKGDAIYATKEIIRSFFV